MNLILVPFLLAAHVPSNNDDTPMYLEYTFNVQVNTTFTIYNGIITNIILSSFTSKFMCNSTAQDKLSCYINSPELIVKSTIVSDTNPFEETLKRTTVYIPFDYINSMPIEMVFDYYGIEEYNVSDDAYPSAYFLKLFGMIASQMNIGTNIRRKKNMFRIWERSYIGKCSTDYTVDDTFEITNLISPRYKYPLKSISNFEFEGDKIKIIEKHRHVQSCHSFNDYMFGIKHANISFPVHHKMKQSISRMRISTKLFTSETQNTYRLYNQDEDEIGFAWEHVNLHLDAIEHV